MHGEGVMHDELMKGSMGVGVGVGCMAKGSLRKGSMEVGVWGRGWEAWAFPSSCNPSFP